MPGMVERAMMGLTSLISRRTFMASSAAWVTLPRGMLGVAAGPEVASGADEGKTLIAITLDLEMSRNFPTWDATHWDYEKGNLNDETKKYAIEAARRVKAHGGVVHFFAVGRVFEQADVDWLKEIVRALHPVGNHTYDHVNVRAKRTEDIQFRFNRSPWLIEGKSPAEVIRENI